MILVILGIIGGVIGIIAGALINFRLLPATGIAYPLLNLLAAFLLLLSCIPQWNMSLFIMESIWIVISLIGLYKGLKDRHANPA